MNAAQVYTGNPALDGITTVAAQSGSSTEIIQKRWDDAGINYIASLAAAGRSEIAAMIQAMPSYAKSVIVAEQNLRTPALTPGKLYSQLMALKQDLFNPEIIQNTIRRSRLQAQSALIGQKIAGGALGGLQGLQKEVEEANAVYESNKAAVIKADTARQALIQSHALASAQFSRNPADLNAANNLLGVLKGIQAATDERTMAEKAMADSQNMLASEQQKLNDEKQKAMSKTAVEVKKEIDERLAKVKASLEASQTRQNVSIYRSTEEMDRYALASEIDEGIIREDGPVLYTGSANALPGRDTPLRLAFAGAGTDVHYVNGVKSQQPQNNEYNVVTDEHGNIQYGPDGDVDVEMTDSYPNVTPKPTPTPKPSPLPTSTPAHKFTINIFKTGDYARNKNIYQGVTDSTLMPLAYLKQAHAQLKKEKVIYPGDGTIYHFDPELSFDEDQINDKGKGKRRLETDCIGMYVLPAMMWYSDDTFKFLIKEAIIKTSTDNTYANSSHKGDFTKDIIESGKMFDGMVLMGEDDKGEPEHAVIFYKEFEYDGTLYKNVVVDISGFSIKEIP